MTRSTPISGLVLGTLVLVLAAALGASRAGGEPVARPAAANTMIAWIVNATPPEDNRGYVTQVAITGQIQAPSHKFAPRKCRLSRTIDVTSPTVGGRIAPVGSTYPTGKTGHFRTGSFSLDYAGYDSADGSFNDGWVLDTGGTATFTLLTKRVEVQKRPGSLRSYTCRPLSLTVQITVPPIPNSS
jgi:hypothetical protein